MENRHISCQREKVCWGGSEGWAILHRRNKSGVRMVRNNLKMTDRTFQKAGRGNPPEGIVTCHEFLSLIRKDRGN